VYFNVTCVCDGKIAPRQLDNLVFYSRRGLGFQLGRTKVRGCDSESGRLFSLAARLAIGPLGLVGRRGWRPGMCWKRLHTKYSLKTD
jgi:hypothetical protein